MALPLLSWVSVNVYTMSVKGGAIAIFVYRLSIFGNAHGLLVCSGAPLGPTAALLVSVSVHSSSVKRGVWRARAALAHNLRPCNDIHNRFPLYLDIYKYIHMERERVL